MSFGAEPICPELEQGELVRINSFALVAYIPDPLGSFLNSIRKELVPGCHLRSHVSLLPPRPLIADQDDAFLQIVEESAQTPEFRVELGGIRIFPVTNVIHLEVKAGKQELCGFHQALNSKALAFKEPFEFHPHITLAQELPAERIEACKAAAEARWEAYEGDRGFLVGSIMFVQNTSANRWIDLAEAHMKVR